MKLQDEVPPLRIQIINVVTPLRLCASMMCDSIAEHHPIRSASEELRSALAMEEIEAWMKRAERSKRVSGTRLVRALRRLHEAHQEHPEEVQALHESVLRCIEIVFQTVRDLNWPRCPFLS